MSKPTEHIGFIGLGIMGKQMASNLMRRGYQLTVFNRSKKSVSELQLQGASAANSPQDVASKSDIVIDMVTDAPDVEQVLLGENGVLSGSKEGLVVIDMSTNSPQMRPVYFYQTRKKWGRVSGCSCHGRRQGGQGGNTDNHGRWEEGSLRSVQAGF